MSWILTAAAILGAAQHSSSHLISPAPVDVMVVGTYHFANPGLDLNNAKADDVLKPVRQRELNALARALAEFKPTRIMVERVAKTPDLVDRNYTTFSIADLAKDRDERVQIGYRLAKLVGHSQVYAIDEQPAAGEPDYFPFDEVAKTAGDLGQKTLLDGLMAKGAAATRQIEELQAKRTIAGVLADRNDAHTTAGEQAMYYEILAIGDTDRQPGADLNAMWYLRNAKIFAKLARIAKPGDRVLVIYGSGHNYWLRHFASTAAGYRNVDPVPFLEKADAAAP
jgi:hypothetical protein